eukprot:365324-Chlamydomonas_euryale.AAC.6
MGPATSRLSPTDPVCGIDIVVARRLHAQHGKEREGKGVSGGRLGTGKGMGFQVVGWKQGREKGEAAGCMR